MNHNCILALAMILLFQLKNVFGSATTTNPDDPPVTLEDVEELFRHPKEFLIHINRIVETKDMIDYKKWNVALHQDGTANISWFNYFLMVKALNELKSCQIELALEALKKITHEEVIVRMKGGSDREYKSILVVLYEMIKRWTFTEYGLKLMKEFKTELAKKVYKVDFKEYDGVSYTEDEVFDSIANAPSCDKDYFKAFVGIFEQDIKERWLELAYIAGLPDIFEISISKLLKSNGDVKTAEILAQLNLYREVSKNSNVIKILVRRKVPMFDKISIGLFRNWFWGIFNIKKSSIRQLYYDMVDQKERARILDVIHLNDITDKQHMVMDTFPALKRVSIPDVISNLDYFMSLPKAFLLNDIGLYQSSWIIHAIENGHFYSVEVLLEERVPLPDQKLLEEAIKNRREGSDWQYTQLFKKYSEFYDPVTRLCIEGPKNCKPRPGITAVVVPKPKLPSPVYPTRQGVFNSKQSSTVTPIPNPVDTTCYYSKAPATAETECNPFDIRS